MSCLRQSACVTRAVGMTFSSYRISYNRRMLLKKAEIEPRSVLSGPIERAIESAGGIILGKEQQVRLALACLLARGHLLIEDLPGVGKTTLAHVLARSLGLQFQRIQFTSDMLPADIIGDRKSTRLNSSHVEISYAVFCLKKKKKKKKK